MSRLLVTLDFDGVVSPIDRTGALSDNPDFESFRLGGFRCLIGEKTLNFLTELAELQEAHPESIAVLWASSWNEITRDFSAKSQGRIPAFDYIDIRGDKAQSISERTLELDASPVLVFEDHRSVHQSLRKRWKRDERFASRKVISFQTDTEHGILSSDILEARSLIAAELQKGF